MEYVESFVKNVALSATSSAGYQILYSGFDGKFQPFDKDRVELEKVGVAALSGAGIGAAISFVGILFHYVTKEPEMYYERM